MTEKDLEQKLVRTVRQRGGIAYKFVSPSHAGVPDRIVLLPGGRVVFVEVKAPGKGRVRKLQEREIERIKSLGTRCVVLRDESQIEDIFAL